MVSYSKILYFCVIFRPHQFKSSFNIINLREGGGKIINSKNRTFIIKIWKS